MNAKVGRVGIVMGMFVSALCVSVLGDTLQVPGQYATIQAAMDAALPGDEVVVAHGIYTGPGNKNLDFHGKAIAVRSGSGDLELCIIDCEGDGRGVLLLQRRNRVLCGEGYHPTEWFGRVRRWRRALSI